MSSNYHGTFVCTLVDRLKN